MGLNAHPRYTRGPARLDPVPDRHPHRARVLKKLVEGRAVNAITVDAETAASVKVALDRMLTIT
jgi:hypothetical protein